MIKRETIIRTAVLIVALLNQVLIIFDKSPLPFDDAMVTQIVTAAITIATALWGWWKNNSFTKPAIKADEYMKQLKEDGYNG